MNLQKAYWSRAVLTALLTLLALGTGAQVKSVDGQFASNQITDMAVIYYGGNQRLKWDENQVAHLVAHTFKDGHIDWLFSGFLFSEMKDGDIAFAHGYAKQAAKKKDWDRLMSTYFEAGRGFDALDKCIGKYKQKIGTPSFRHKIVISLPIPISGQADWGYVGWRKLNFSKTDHKLKAVKWYVEKLVATFEKQHYQNIELEGFSWRDEDLGKGKSPDMFPEVSQIIHSTGKRFYWAPYYRAKGRFDWRKNGFDIAYLQPNYYQRDDLTRDNIVNACTNARKYGMAMMVEMDNRVMTSKAKYLPRINEYYSVFGQEGVLEQSALLFYLGNNTIIKLDESTDPDITDFVEKMAGTIVKRREAMSGSKQKDWRSADYWHF